MYAGGDGLKEISFPLILVNLKTYREAVGELAVKLVSIAEEAAKAMGVCVALAPQTVDLYRIVSETNAPIFAQHIDPVGYGKYTGHVLPEAVAKAGCAGTLINHSERRLCLGTIKNTVGRAKEAGLIQVVCVDSVKTGRSVAPFDPNVIAIEPPELIGTGIPVSKARPEVVSGAVEAVHEINPRVRVLCGAGITSGEDVAAAINLGAEGVLVASGVVKAPDPYEKLLELAEAARR
ncbi:MAG: triose-phosphate isomerase [Candidatus Bathyarchaeota archaeon]|nr:MAG: triose-phosphate isomerase [Candidatus Bathyarchaeota archaeon]